MCKANDLAVLFGNAKSFSIEVRFRKNMSFQRCVVSVPNQSVNFRKAIPEIDQQWWISIQEGTILNQFGTGGWNNIRNRISILAE